MPYLWVCDTCGQPILKAEDGWVEWINVPQRSGGYRVRDMRLVHHVPTSPRVPNAHCQFDERRELAKDEGIVGDRSLVDYIGPDGLMNLLEHAADPSFEDIDIHEVIKRIQVPGYDLAKSHFDAAVQEGVIDLNQPKGFYTQRQIESVIAEYFPYQD